MSASQSIHLLLSKVEFQNLASIVPKEKGFNVIEMLKTTVNENAWSRVVAFLFDSRGEHGLGNLALKLWCQLFDCPVSFRNIIISTQASAEFASENEWVTSKRRRLDILIRLSDHCGQLCGILGIENKVDAGESDDQVGHYQRELAIAFPDIPKLIIFLTPSGRKPDTADPKETGCPAFAAPYESLINLFQDLQKIQLATEDLKRLLQSLSSYVRNKIIAPMEETEKIRNLVRELYSRPENRQGMRLLAEHLPCVGHLCEGIEKIVDDECKLKFPDAKGYWLYHPKRSNNTVELKWLSEEMDNYTWSGRRKIGINFMLRCHSKVPDIGDEFYFYVAAWRESEKDKALASDLNLSGFRSSPPKRLGARWEVLWIGKSYQLCDLGVKDTAGLANLMANGINETYVKIRAKVFKVFPPKN